VRKRKKERRPRGAIFSDYLTRKDLMERLGVSIQTISRMHRAGKLPTSIVFNGVHLYKKEDVEKWLLTLTEPKNRKNNNRK
jgi:predicted site-specific integrase-resolvase